MNVTLPIIGTPSRTEGGARCYRRHVVSDILSLQRRGYLDVTPTQGTVIHSIAAAHWRGEDPQVEASKAYNEYAATLDGGDLGHEAFVHIAGEYARQAVLAGDALFAKLPGWELVVCEKRIIVDLGIGARLSFQLDRLAHHPETGTYSLNDTKSHKKQTPYRRKEWEERYMFSVQQKIYRWATLREWGIKPENLEHFIEGVSKEIPSSVTYLRLPAWTDGELEEAKELLLRLCQKDAELVAESMRDDGTVDLDVLLNKALTETDFNPDACMAFHTRCPLFDVCRAPVEQRVGLVRSDFEYVEPLFLE